MSYDSKIAAKLKEIEELQKEKTEQLAYLPLLKEGQCLKRKEGKYSLHGRHYTKILHVSDSGYGYPLIVAEWFEFRDLRLYHIANKDVVIPDQDVYMTVSQWRESGSGLKYYEPITDDEYHKAKSEVIRLFTTPDVPSAEIATVEEK